jgi:hypothetical protein
MALDQGERDLTLLAHAAFHELAGTEQSATGKMLTWTGLQKSRKAAAVVIVEDDSPHCAPTRKSLFLGIKQQS